MKQLTLNMLKNNLPNLKKMIWPILASVRKKAPVNLEKISLPDAVVFQDIDINDEQLRAFRSMFPYLLGEMPLSYLYTLAQRAHLYQMSNPVFPFKLPGIVHLDNQMQCVHPLDGSMVFNMEQSVSLSSISANGGVKIIAKTDFCQLQKRCVEVKSTYLIRTKKMGRSKTRKQPVLLPKGSKLIQTLDVQSNAGRLYARVSGDYNPIHLYSWSAKLFGFKSPIIHGMYLQAATQNVIEKRSKKAVMGLNISFKSPVVIPTHVDCYTHDETGSFYLTVNDEEEVKSLGVFNYQFH